MLADPVLREALNCIRCGACLNICPVYQKVGGHAYGWVYPGPIGAIVSPALVGLKQAKDLPFASSLCGACRDACPVKINIPKLLLHLRHELAESPDPQVKASTGFENFMARSYALLMSKPKLLNFSHKVARILRIPLVTRGLTKAPLPFLSKWTKARDLPAVPASTFHEVWQRDFADDTESDGK